jgi:hypothetical protein
MTTVRLDGLKRLVALEVLEGVLVVLTLEHTMEVQEPRHPFKVTMAAQSLQTLDTI